MFLSLLITGGTPDLRVNCAYLEIKKNTGEDERKNLSPDIIILSSPTSIGIEEIRILQNKLSLKPYEKKIKVALIFNAENLTTEAQNAFLKTVEEPAENSLIILTAPDSSWLLPTLVSRCQIIQLPLTSQISLSDKEVKEFQEIFSKITLPKIGERWETLEKLGIYQDRLKAFEWVDKMTFFVRKLLIDIYSKKEKNSPDNHLISKYLNILISLSQTKSYLQANTNIRLTLENFLLNLEANSPGR